jgi:hypothetical protein
MHIVRPFAALACLLAACAAPAAETSLPGSPEAAAKRLVELNNSRALQTPEGLALLAGELEEVVSPGEGVLPAPNRIVRTGAGKAVARLPGTADERPDIYLYLEDSGHGWQTVAFRSLALAGILAEMVRLDALAPSQDPAVREAIQNGKLTLSTDQALLNWAQTHRRLLDRVRDDPVAPGLEREIKAAGAGSVSREGDAIVILIGGVGDNEVGFLLPLNGRVPPIDSHDHIWIEAAVDGWYLFKTT